MKLATYAPVAAALLALAACEPPTAAKPDPPSAVDVVLSGVPGEMVTSVEPNAPHRAQCTVELQATAKGPSGRAVRWGDGRIFWYYGIDRSVARDTTPVPASEIITAWAINAIGVGATQNARWTFQADAPFKATMEMDYAEQGGEGRGTASFTFTCGPTPPAERAPAPVVRNVRVSFPSGGDTVILPGGVMTIRYEAQGDWGVWESGVQITGAFTARVPARNAVTTARGGTVTGTVQVQVPADAPVGQPLQVQGYATDVFLQPGVAAEPRALRVLSNVPPVVLSAHFTTSPLFLGHAQHRLVGRFAEGDTMQLAIRTAHSRGPGWVVFALGGGVNVRDSVAVPFSGSLSDVVKMPVRAGWAGASTLSVQVRNNEAMYSAAVTAPADSFGVFPSRTAPFRSATIAGPADDMVLDEARGLLYLSMPHTGRVQVLSLATMSVASFPVTTLPGGMGLDLTRGGDTLIVALGRERALAVVDLSRPDAAPVKVPLTVDGLETAPLQVRVAANGKVLVMGGVVDTYQHRVVEMSSSGSGQRLRTDAAQAYFLVHRSADHGRVFFESHDHHCAIVYDSDTDRFGACRPLEREGTWSSTPSGSRFASGYDVHDAAGGRVRTFPLVTGAPMRYTTGLSPDGSHVYASAAGGVVKLRVSDGGYLERLSLPRVPDGRILFTGGGRYLVAVHARVGYSTEATEIYVVDLR